MWLVRNRRCSDYYSKSCQIAKLPRLDVFPCSPNENVILELCHYHPRSTRRIDLAKYISLVKNNILIDNTSISEIYRTMSLNELPTVERVNPDSIERVMDDDNDEICIVFEKIAPNIPIENESKTESPMKNEPLREDSVKFDSSPKDVKAFLQQPASEPVNSSQQLEENFSEFIDHSKVKRKKGQLQDLRQWDYTDFGRDFIIGQKGEKKSLPFTVMSYNVLSQLLLENHPHLYSNHNYAALSWEWRSKVLMEEIEAASPDILCLQEVQESHLECFYYPQLLRLGYKGLYKKRTGDKPDGVAIYFRDSVFTLEEYTTVEFMQPIMPVLNRDNVALIARFSSKMDPSLPHLCVATTHLLYNPRRMDVKLAQMQLLLAELERLAFVRDRPSPSYYPLIVTGDLNVTPKSSLYRLLTTGLLLDSDVTDEMLDVLGITNNCQHFSILRGRQCSGTSPIDRLSELRGLKVYNSDNVEALHTMTPSNDNSEDGKVWNVERKKGHLSHNFILKSAYEHRNSRGKEVTTKQDKWVTVDYIFYSCIARGLNMEPIEGNLKLISRHGLLCKEECFAYGPIPNLGSPSDHFPLLCKFVLT
ncbi:protein angel homolog 2 isoform X2 [Hetaerina americana]|uniref:protein angel homolog 2 isoform X2 n=1 Tax=Hetaerina americana TaxID=62018 RepID=UPI003A7F6091